MARRVKRLTGRFAATLSEAEQALLASLKERDVVSVAPSGEVSCYPDAPRERLTPAERALVLRLLGYATPDARYPRIGTHEDILGGAPVVGGSRIPVSQIFQAMRADTDSRWAYDLGLDDREVEEAMGYARDHLEQIEREIYENEHAFDHW
jgi:uncharacterized protein (DUF433 family)